MPEIIHVERHSELLTEERLQAILHSYYKPQTINSHGIHISVVDGSTYVPLRVNFEELLEHDDRVAKLKLCDPKRPVAADDSQCRGCYSLGTACGRCKKCEEYLIQVLRDLVEFKHTDREDLLEHCRLIVRLFDQHHQPGGSSA